MLKKKKKNILKNKTFILKTSFFFKFQLKKFLNKNYNILQKSRAFLFFKSPRSKKFNVCLQSGKYKSNHSYLKLHRSVSNSFVRFNYFPNIKSFGQ